jgi:hypothetical protein
MSARATGGSGDSTAQRVMGWDRAKEDAEKTRRGKARQDDQRSAQQLN